MIFDEELESEIQILLLNSGSLYNSSLGHHGLLQLKLKKKLTFTIASF